MIRKKPKCKHREPSNKPKQVCKKKDFEGSFFQRKEKNNKMRHLCVKSRNLNAVKKKENDFGHFFRDKTV